MAIKRQAQRVQVHPAEFGHPPFRYLTKDQCGDHRRKLTSITSSMLSRRKSAIPCLKVVLEGKTRIRPARVGRHECVIAFFMKSFLLIIPNGQFGPNQKPEASAYSVNDENKGSKPKSASDLAESVMNGVKSAKKSTSKDKDKGTLVRLEAEWELSSLCWHHCPYHVVLSMIAWKEIGGRFDFFL
jgi:hypothetical protein